MFQELVKTFFMVQIACEEAISVVKKQADTFCEKKEELKHKVADELKSEKEKVFDKAKFEGRVKENVAGLRKGFKSFDKACYSLSQLLVETDELKETLIQNDVSTKELVHT